jgi:hypothetical protein
LRAIRGRHGRAVSNRELAWGDEEKKLQKRNLAPLLAQLFITGNFDRAAAKPPRSEQG